MNHPQGGRTRTRGAGVGLSCPNPSAHPVGVRHTKETARSCSTAGSDSSPRLSGLALVAGVGLVPSTPAQAEPDIDDVQARVDRLYHQAEQASERYNDAKLELARPPARPRLPEGGPGRQEAKRRRESRRRSRTRSSASTRARASRPSARSCVSDDPEPSCPQLSTMSAFNDLQAQLFDGLHHRAQGARHPPRRDRESARPRSPQTKKKLRHGEDHDRRQARRGQGAARQAQGRGARATSRGRRDSSPRLPDVPASGRAAAAVSYAHGPGRRRLRLRRRGPERVRLLRPHDDGLGPGRRRACRTPRAPSTAPARTSSASDLQPGDLVFYYSPISHVGMYIGNGMIVHAANPGTGVRVSGAVLHAVRRRGPPWLTARTTHPEGRSPTSGGWPAFRSSCSLVAGVLVAWRGAATASRRRAATPRRRWRRPGPAGPRRDRAAATSTDAVAAGDADAAAALAAGRPGGGRLAAGAVVDNARALRVARLHAALRRRGPSGTSTADGAWAAAVRRHLAVRAASTAAPPHAEVTLRLRRRGRPRGRWSASAVASGVRRCG